MSAFKIGLGRVLVILVILASQVTFAFAQSQHLERVLTPNGQELNGNAIKPSVSADGRYIAFASSATNLTVNQPTPNSQTNQEGIFVYDRTTKRTVRATNIFNGKSPHIRQLSISGDGNFVLFGQYLCTV